MKLATSDWDSGTGRDENSTGLIEVYNHCKSFDTCIGFYENGR